MSCVTKKNIAALCCVLVSAVTPSYGLAGEKADEVPWKVSAEKMTRSVDNQEVIAEGDVEIIRTGTPAKPVAIYADWIRYDMDKGMVYARGNVKMRSPGEEADAERGTIVLGDETATLFNAEIYMKQQNLHFKAEEAQKNGEMSYWFKNGIFTTCDSEADTAPVWSLEAKEIDIDIDGFIWMKHSFLNIKDVPVLYLPIMGFPGRMARQTGFLFPEMSNSTLSGLGVVTPFFVNLSPSSDVTLYPGVMSKRGLLGGAEFRYVNAENSKFTAIGTYINDRTDDTADDDYKDDGYFRTQQDRYWLRGKADHDFGQNLIARLDIDTASDRNYLLEFENGITGFDASNDSLLADYNRGLMDGTSGWRQSSGQISKSWAAAFVGGEVMLVDDLDPGLTPTTSMVHSLPNLVSQGNLELWETAVNFNWDADYANYYREEGVGTQRVDLRPRLDAPLALADWLEASVSGGLDQTFWSVEEQGSTASWTEDSSPSRSSWSGKVDIGTSLQRDFGVNMGKTKFLNHLLRPELTYTYVDVIDADDQAALPDFDERDRITESSVVGYGFANHFRVGGIDEDGKGWSRYFGQFKIDQGYDFRQKETPFTDMAFDLDIYPIEGLRLNYTTKWNMYGAGIVSYALLSRYTNKRGDSAGVDYIYDKFGEIHTLNAEAQVRISRTLAGRVEFKQSLGEEDSAVTQQVALLYQPGCWGMKLEYSDTQDDQRVALMVSLMGAGQSYGFGYGSSHEGGELFSTMDTLELENGY
ncbi:MAG: LPS assembly protein LptD [Desulfobulbaceae bacterium]|nr:LPS assembly protein LptD [Desulfobulbaceae bacterium]